MVLVTKASNISLINWCLDGKQPSHIVSTPIASTMHFQLLKKGNDFLLYKMLDLPRMPIEKGHSYGKVLQNQKKLCWKKGLACLFLTCLMHTFKVLVCQITIHFFNSWRWWWLTCFFNIWNNPIKCVIGDYSNLPTSTMMKRVSAISVAHTATHLLSHIQIDLTFIINHKKCPIYNICVVGRPIFHILLKLGKQCLPCAMICIWCNLRTNTITPWLVSEVLISSSMSNSSMWMLPLPSTMPIQNQTRSKALHMESQLGVKDYGDFSLHPTPFQVRFGLPLYVTW